MDGQPLTKAKMALPWLCFRLEKVPGKRLADGMNVFCLSFLSLLFGFSLVFASPLDPEGDAKITRNEAQHIALRPHQGARVTAAKLETVEGKLVWLIELKEGERRTKVTVDAMSGRILPHEKPNR